MTRVFAPQAHNLMSEVNCSCLDRGIVLDKRSGFQGEFEHVLSAVRSCVLVANEPRLYREAVAQYIRMCRPDLDVIAVSTADLDLLVKRLRPDVVFSSGVSTIEPPITAWIALDPTRDESIVVVTALGRKALSGAEIPEIVSLLEDVGLPCL